MQNKSGTARTVPPNNAKSSNLRQVYPPSSASSSANLPNSREAERIVIGCILVGDMADEAVKMGLTADHFLASSYRAMYQAIHDLATEGQPIDVNLVAERMKKDGTYEIGHGHAGIAETLDGISRANFAGNAKLIIELAAKREALKRAHQMAEAIEGNASLEEITELHRAAGDVLTVKQSPEEAEQSIQWPDPLDLYGPAYHGLAGDLVRAIEPHTEADPVAILVQILTAFGSVIGRSAHFVAENTRHYPNLFAVLVGNTSKGRKGTSWAQSLAILRAADAEWAGSNIVGGLSSGEGLIWSVRDEVIKKEPVRNKGVITGYREVITDEAVTDKRLLIVESEFASVLKQAVRDGNILSAVIRQAWDDGNLRTLTKNSPARATDAHISMIGHITRDELRRHLEATEYANGFANRFLWLAVRRSKSLPEGGNLDLVAFDEIITRMRDAITHAKQTTLMKRDEAARELWFEVYEDLSEGKPGMLGAVTSRAEAQVMRLAVIYALLDRSNAIRRPHLEAALELWRYAEESAKYIFGEAMGDPVADSILVALREAGPDGLTRTGISDHFSRKQSAAAIGRALTSLAEAGRAICRKESGEGRPVEKWFALTSMAKKAKYTKKGGEVEGDISLNSLISPLDSGEVEEEVTL